MAITLANATLACLHPPILRSGSVTVDGGRIVDIDSVPRREANSIEDCGGRILMPGNVCSHTHLYSALARGMPAPRRAPRNFPEILELVWWRLDRALDMDAIKSSALVGILDAVRCGTTALVDHHASPNCIDGSLSVIAGAFEEIGARGLLCYEVTDRGGREQRDAGLRENERFISQRRHPLVGGMVGAHASFTLDDETLESLADMRLRLRTGVHIHLAEDVADQQDSQQRSGQRAAIRLRDAGIFDELAIAAHGVHLDHSELDALQAEKTWLVHNCRSNMNNRVGRAPVETFGERTALGTDGIDGDMFSESRSAFFRSRENDVNSDAARYCAMLSNGAALASTALGTTLGVLETGAAADLILLDYNPPTPMTSENLAWHWMFGMHAGLVRSVMIDGRWVMRDREFITIDEEKILDQARRQATRLWQRMESLP